MSDEIELFNKEELEVNISSNEIDTDIYPRGPKGDPGEPGEPGEPGYTPIKGVDYFTSDDISEIIEDNSLVNKNYVDDKIPPKMVILEYGKSSWSDFINAYLNNVIVYCRAGSGSDPSQGAQLRMAFMAYVAGSATNPTSVEFQYYRSVTSHSDSQQGDQVYIYKLEKNGTWSVTVREAYTKINVGDGLKKTYNNGVLTISLS